MFFLNLSVLEFFALLGTLGSAITALYLLDRRKRRRVVSTLRFWTPAASVEERRSRRHMQQPWSLLLQLLSLVLLLLAIARLQWGSRPQNARDHVFLLDTSSWSAAPGVLENEQKAIRSILKSLPMGDRVLIVSTGALSTPSERFTSDRTRSDAAVEALHSGVTALDLEGAITYAQAAQHWSGNAPGQIVYVGPARTDHTPQSIPRNFRLVKIAAPEGNVGVRAASARRAENGNWNASVTLHNYTGRTQTIHLQTGFGSASFAPRRYTMAPNGEVIASYSFAAHSAGALHAQIEETDALRADNAVQLELRNHAKPRLLAFTRRREQLLPLIPPELFYVEFIDPGQIREGRHADLVLFDEFNPSANWLRQIQAPALFLHPPRENAPIPITETVGDATLATWHTSSFGENGLRTRELRFGSANVLQSSKGDVPIASIRQGPVAIARNGDSQSEKFVVIGFDLLDAAYRTELTTPLLMAGALSWLAPAVFQPSEFLAQHTGTVNIPLESGENVEALQVTDERGLALPFSVANESLQFSSDRAGIIRVTSNTRAREIASVLPEVAIAEWQSPDWTLHNPPSGYAVPVASDLWQWLAACGGLGLLLEWLLFGSSRRRLVMPGKLRTTSTHRKQPERKVRMSA